MPNWCDNTVKIEGPVDKIYDLAKAMERDEMLSHMAPLPTKEWHYGTAVDVWGTKWGTGTSDGYMDYSVEDGVISASFQTAWSPPTRAYDTYLMENPDVDIYATYYEGGSDFAGIYDNGDDGYREGLPNSKCPTWETDPVLKELDETYNIVEMMSDWEEENDEQ